MADTPFPTGSMQPDNFRKELDKRGWALQQTSDSKYLYAVQNLDGGGEVGYVNGARNGWTFEATGPAEQPGVSTPGPVDYKKWAAGARQHYAALKNPAAPETPAPPAAPAPTPVSAQVPAPPNEHLQKLSNAVPPNCSKEAVAHNIQALLKEDDPNVDLGKTGPKHDGVDNQVGPKTKAALEAYIKNHGGDPKLLASVSGITLDGTNFDKNNAALASAIGDAQKNNLLQPAQPGAPTMVAEHSEKPAHHSHHHRVMPIQSAHHVHHNAGPRVS